MRVAKPLKTERRANIVENIYSIRILVKFAL